MNKRPRKPVKKKIEVYVGPTIAGVATHNTIFCNGIPESLKEAALKEPAFKNLVVPVTDLSATIRDLENKTGAIHVFYSKALNYKQ